MLAIGIIDSATRMGFLLFLPFILKDKGASVQTIGLALTLVFAGGAAGKLACTFIGARLGAVGTVWLTEGLTAAGILALAPLPLEAALVLLPVIGIALNGTSSVLYGSVPALVAPKSRTRALSIFYTGTIGSGAIAPTLYGLVGDRFGVWKALALVAVMVLLDSAAFSAASAGVAARIWFSGGVNASNLRRWNTSSAPLGAFRNASRKHALEFRARLLQPSRLTHMKLGHMELAKWSYQ